MNDHQKHMYGLLLKAGEALRAFQLYELGQGHGNVTNATNNQVLHAIAEVFAAQRAMEDGP